MKKWFSFERLAHAAWRQKFFFLSLGIFLWTGCAGAPQMAARFSQDDQNPPQLTPRDTLYPVVPYQQPATTVLQPSVSRPFPLSPRSLAQVEIKVPETASSPSTSVPPLLDLDKVSSDRNLPKSLLSPPQQEEQNKESVTLPKEVAENLIEESLVPSTEALQNPSSSPSPEAWEEDDESLPLPEPLSALRATPHESAVAQLQAIFLNPFTEKAKEVEIPSPQEKSAPPSSSEKPLPSSSLQEKEKKTPSSKQEENLVRLLTPYGEIIVELDFQAAPLTSANFKKLVQEGFYNQTTFHRVIPGFIIQGGCPLTKEGPREKHGEGGPGYSLLPEIKRRHQRGSVAMARLPDILNPEHRSNGSQFYICVGECDFLDEAYTVFGQVMEGMEVVDRIVKQQRDERDNPIETIRIQAEFLAPPDGKGQAEASQSTESQ